MTLRWHPVTLKHTTNLLLIIMNCHMVCDSIEALCMCRHMPLGGQFFVAAVSSLAVLLAGKQTHLCSSNGDCARGQERVQVAGLP